MNIKEIHVWSRLQAQSPPIDIPFLLISICDVSYPALSPPGATDVLRLEFVDVDITKLGLAEYLNHVFLGRRVGDCLIQPAHAQSLAEFLASHPNDEVLAVHCWAGCSRSPSTAMAIADVLNLPRSSIHWFGDVQKPAPNKYVYETMVEGLHHNLKGVINGIY